MTSPKKLPRTTLALLASLLAMLTVFVAPAWAEEESAPQSQQTSTEARQTAWDEAFNNPDIGAPVVEMPAVPDDFDVNFAGYEGEGPDDSATQPAAPVPHQQSSGVKYGAAARALGLRCFGRLAGIVGTPHEDRIYGTEGQDVIIGRGGGDTITSGNANDFICGWGGDDQAYGLAGNDHIAGQKGVDILEGVTGDDYMWGGLGDDILTGASGTDHLYGDGGADTIFGGFSSPGEGNGGIPGDSNDTIHGGASNDTLDGGDFNDDVLGERGNDVLLGGDGTDHMKGGPGRDAFTGDAGNDSLTGVGGDDIFFGGDGNDTMWGDGGLDWMWGEAGGDSLHGGNDWDTINGGDGGDSLFGDGGSDTLCGGPSFNTLRGGDQDDFLSGDADDCTFSFANLLATFSVDTDTTNLNDGGKGIDLCVSPSFALSPQTINCEFDGFIRLDVEITGQGNVSSGGAIGILNEFGIDCTNGSPTGNVCSMFFFPTEVPISITLTATPAAGFGFNGWSGTPAGTCPGLTNPCTFSLDTSRTVTASFVDVDTLTLTVSGPGTVTSSPGGGLGSCTAGTSPCTGTYTTGTAVTLTSTSATTWGGVPAPGCAVGTTCAFTMSGNRTITAATT